MLAEPDVVHGRLSIRIGHPEPFTDIVEDETAECDDEKYGLSCTKQKRDEDYVHDES